MSWNDAKLVVDGLVSRMEAKAPSQEFKAEFALGALSQQATDWLRELQELKSNKLQEEMEQLRRRLSGESNE